MKSALMIAYWFPPEGHAAVYRPLRFLRNLPASGWVGRVLAGAAQFDRYDPGLLHQVPEGTEVVRVAGEDVWQWFQRKRGERLRHAAPDAGSAPSAMVSPRKAPSAPSWTERAATVRSQLRSAVRHAESWWYHPDTQRPWIRPAVRAAVAMCATSRPDVLWATGPPWSAFIVAQRVSRLTRVPYVLDFRTSWTIVPSPFEALRPAWAQRRDRRVLRELLHGAQAVTFFYEAEAECFWRMFRGALDPSRVHVIPNGFDGDVEPFVESGAPKFTILYAGTLSDYGYEGFVEALAQFIAAEPARAKQVAVRFVGEIDPSFVTRLNDLRLSDVVSVGPPVSHEQVGRLQRAAHALLMLERKPSHKGYELLAGAKLFGYLKAGKPILGVVPHGEAERVLRDVGVTTIADAASVEAIRRVLEAMFQTWCSGGLAALVPDRTACERYSGRRQGAALARALDGLPPLRPFVPGIHDVAPSLRAEFAAEGWA
jgi:hypothetical protein